MDVTWTATQKQRLIELNADETLHDCVFPDTVAREKRFKQLERELVKTNKEQLLALKNTTFRPLLCQLESKLVDRLTQEGFVQVVTPILLSRGMLNKMTITSEHPLVKQVFGLIKINVCVLC
ncbi:MAG: hypothetical protein RJR35_08955 [Thermoanaerobacterales bacterium]|nr:hypothetical protein [Thermoanaerobacterales bacterium]